ncbi:hypothetical protein BGP77_12685 [Saccharospirillum sp. MSK14-1]|nr:hypothetical protein BGP77_12685 [Saccharospirillum sp. MSK14-1]
MVVVNFRLVMGADHGRDWLLSLALLFEGRASALFVVLAGIGISLMTAHARGHAEFGVVRQQRRGVVRRGLLLFVVGSAYTAIWPADILHYYGLYFVFAAWVLVWSDRALLWLAAVVILAFSLLLLMFDYEAGWDWSSLTYQDSWLPLGMIRRLFFNGFHPVLPWLAFLLWGMWLGRRDLTDARIRRRLLIGAVIVLAMVEGSFWGLGVWVRDQFAATPSSDLAVLTSIDMMPPLPQYVLSASASATAVLLVCIALALRKPGAMWINALSATGRLSLTLYVAHVIVGMGSLEALGLLGGQGVECSWLAALVFCCAAVVVSVFWLRRFRTGPLEWCVRKIAG